ncbi:MAG: F0F1 ATP synthase subunit delta [Pseudomonadales bacterium]
MAELATLARPYARAAFDQANSSNALQEWSEALQLLSAVSQHDKVEALYGSPSLTAEQQADAVITVCGEALSAKMQNLVKLLAENGRLSLLPEVSSQFEQFKANRERTVDVEISSAFDVDSATEQRLADALAKKLDRSVNVNSTVNKDLLGGVLIRAGDLVIDDSVRAKLGKLAEAMGT